jgi:hypothetical protein
MKAFVIRYLELMAWPGPLALTYALAFGEAWFHHGLTAVFFFLVATWFLFGNTSDRGEKL